MKDEIITELPEIFRNHICTLKKASLDNSKNENMCESLLEVIDFDKIPNVYSRGKGWRAVPKSNDALYVSTDGKWHFIEFKNGDVKKHEIYRKLYDSLIMLVELNVIPDLDFSRNNFIYILVYNSDKYPLKAEESSSRDSVYSYFMNLAQEEERLFEVDKFEKYLFHETHTYTVEQFGDKFVEPMEKIEGFI